MSDNSANEVKYIDDSLGQRRLLRSKLNNTLTKLIIASLAGCAFVATASSGGTRPMLVALSIVMGLLLIAVALVLIRFFRRRGEIIASAREHEQQ